MSLRDLTVWPHRIFDEKTSVHFLESLVFRDALRCPQLHNALSTASSGPWQCSAPPATVSQLQYPALGQPSFGLPRTLVPPETRQNHPAKPKLQ